MFTSGNFPDVSRGNGIHKEGGREEDPQALVGRGIKNRGQIRKQKAEYKIQTREGKGIKKQWAGGGVWGE